MQATSKDEALASWASIADRKAVVKAVHDCMSRVAATSGLIAAAKRVLGAVAVGDQLARVIWASVGSAIGNPTRVGRSC